MLNPVQILLLAFFVIAVVKVIARLRSKELSGRTAALWIVFWVAAAGVVLKPDSTFYFAKLIGVGRGADLIVYVALTGLFFMVFRLVVGQEKINREITKLVREKALEKRD